MSRITPLALLAVLTLAAPDSRAAEKEPAAQVVPERWTGPFGSLKLGFSAWRGALEIDAQAGWAFRKITVGVVLEHNPFIDLSKPAIDAGGFGFGAFVGLRVPLTVKVGLRFEGLAGGSVLLFDMFGYSKGDVGLWLGARVMGLDIELHEHATLTVDVVDVVLPAYHLGSMPLIYPQWRWSVGVVFH
jgi:hypothetical protein